MLNEYQKRELSITLRIVEETMQDIERILHNGIYPGTLYDMKCSIPQEVKTEILRRSTFIKDRIKIISKIFDLSFKGGEKSGAIYYTIYEGTRPEHILQS